MEERISVSWPMLLSSEVRAPQKRYWFWRGWRIRYCFLPAAEPSSPPAPPILLLHGFGASLEQWRDNFGGLAKHRTVYALDLLGFGDSQKAATIFNVDLWTAQVRDFGTMLIGGPMVLVGHSLGSLVALNTSVVHPEMAYRLVMLSLPAAREELLTGLTGNLTRPLERLFSTPLLIRPLFQFVRRPQIIRGALRGIYQQTPDRVDIALIEQFVMPTRDRGAARTLCYLVRSRTEVQFTPETKKLVAQLAIPSLLIWGQLDKVIPLAWGNQLVPLNPLITFQVVPNVGHCAYDEEPDRINEHILNWLETN